MAAPGGNSPPRARLDPHCLLPLTPRNKTRADEIVEPRPFSGWDCSTSSSCPVDYTVLHAVWEQRWLQQSPCLQRTANQNKNRAETLFTRPVFIPDSLHPEGWPATLDVPPSDHKLVDPAQFSFSSDWRSPNITKLVEAAQGPPWNFLWSQITPSFTQPPGTHWQAQKAPSPQGLPGGPVPETGLSEGAVWPMTTSPAPPSTAHRCFLSRLGPQETAPRCFRQQLRAQAPPSEVLIQLRGEKTLQIGWVEAELSGVRPDAALTVSVRVTWNSGPWWTLFETFSGAAWASVSTSAGSPQTAPLTICPTFPAPPSSSPAFSLPLPGEFIYRSWGRDSEPFQLWGRVERPGMKVWFISASWKQGNSRTRVGQGCPQFTLQAAHTPGKPTSSTIPQPWI